MYGSLVASLSEFWQLLRLWQTRKCQPSQTSQLSIFQFSCGCKIHLMWFIFGLNLSSIFRPFIALWMDFDSCYIHGILKDVWNTIKCHSFLNSIYGTIKYNSIYLYSVSIFQECFVVLQLYETNFEDVFLMANQQNVWNRHQTLQLSIFHPWSYEMHFIFNYIHAFSIFPLSFVIL